MGDHVFHCDNDGKTYSCCKNEYALGLYNNKWLRGDYRGSDEDDWCDGNSAHYDKASGKCDAGTDLWDGFDNHSSAKKYCDGYKKIE